MAYSVDLRHDEQLVVSTWHGPVDATELFAYIDEVWRLPEVRAYNEIIDFREVTEVTVASNAIEELAAYSHSFDNPDRPARSAVLASAALIYGLSRMFATLREQLPDNLREFRVFEDTAAADAWLAATER